MATDRLIMTVCKVKVNHVVMSGENKSRRETDGRGRDDTRGGNRWRRAG